MDYKYIGYRDGDFGSIRENCFISPSGIRGREKRKDGKIEQVIQNEPIYTLSIRVSLHQL